MGMSQNEIKWTLLREIFLFNRWNLVYGLVFICYVWGRCSLQGEIVRYLILINFKYKIGEEFYLWWGDWGTVGIFYATGYTITRRFCGKVRKVMVNLTNELYKQSISNISNLLFFFESRHINVCQDRCSHDTTSLRK